MLAIYWHTPPGVACEVSAVYLHNVIEITGPSSLATCVMRPFIYSRSIWWFPRHLPGQNAHLSELFPGVNSETFCQKVVFLYQTQWTSKHGGYFCERMGHKQLVYDALGEFGSISDIFRLVVIHTIYNFDVVLNVHQPDDCLRDYMSIWPSMKWTAIYHIVKWMYLINDVFPANCEKYMTKLMANVKSYIIPKIWFGIEEHIALRC